MSTGQIIRERVSAASVVGDYQLDTPAIFDDPVGPRTGRNHPATSHAAGDRSQKTIHALRMNLLILIRENPLIIGTELNDLYKDTYQRRGWKRVAYDSPRKRAFEMAREGVLEIVGERDGGQQLIITEAGLKVVTS